MCAGLLLAAELINFLLEAVDLIPGDVAVTGGWCSKNLKDRLELESWGLSMTEKRGGFIGLSVRGGGEEHTEPSTFWNREGGVFEASHSLLL